MKASLVEMEVDTLLGEEVQPNRRRLPSRLRSPLVAI